MAEEEKKKCNCIVCQHSKEFTRIVNQLADPSDRKIMWHFYECLADAETMVEVAKMKHDGTWPGWEHNRPRCATPK